MTCAAPTATARTPRSRTAVRPRRTGHPPPARVRGLRRALHHLRARAAARDHRGQALGPARAVRPREAVALGRGRAAQAADPARAHRAHGVGHRAAAGKHGRAGHALLGHRRAGHGGAEGPRSRGLCALRLGLSRLPRGGRLPGGAGRDRRRARGAARRRAGAPSRVPPRRQAESTERRWRWQPTSRQRMRRIAASWGWRCTWRSACWGRPRPTRRSAPSSPTRRPARSSRAAGRRSAAARTRRRTRWRAPASGRAARPCTSRWSPAPTTAAPSADRQDHAVRRGDPGRRHAPRGGAPPRTPTPRSPGAAWRCCARPA